MAAMPCNIAISAAAQHYTAADGDEPSPHVQDGDGTYRLPLFLVPLKPLARQLPPNDDGNGRGDGAPSPADAPPGDVLAYNTEDANLYLLTDGPGGLAGGDGGGWGPAGRSVRKLREFDNPVCALAVSADGLRVAVGFEDGRTAIYSYDGFDPSATGEGGGGGGGAPPDGSGVHHPFVLLSRAEEESGYLFQSRDGGGEVRFDGPRADATVRQLAFYPRCGARGMSAYYLTVASESGNQPLMVVDATSEETAGEEAQLEDHWVLKFARKNLSVVASCLRESDSLLSNNINNFLPCLSKPTYEGTYGEFDRNRNENTRSGKCTRRGCLVRQQEHYNEAKKKKAMAYQFNPSKLEYQNTIENFPRLLEAVRDTGCVEEELFDLFGFAVDRTDDGSV